MRSIEHPSLKKQNKWNPLIICLLIDEISLTTLLWLIGHNLDFNINIRIMVVDSDSLSRNIPAEVTSQGGGQGEGGHDVAEGVDHVGWDGPAVAVPLHDAGDAVPVTNPVQGCDQAAAPEQEETCEPVVKSGHQTLGLWRTNLNIVMMTFPELSFIIQTFLPTGTKSFTALNTPSILGRLNLVNVYTKHQDPVMILGFLKH